ncbi:HD domain-containing protein [Enterobacter hormaechei]|uniref:HD domain-containing protein n=1 Tax=Enterobacter hormaechei TaxID=158836 RepID=A0A4Y5ZP69_9ENTR|nr:HD domain-containing protein [Enterobacter hormaechei]
MYLFESLNQLIQTYLPEDQIKRLQQAYLVARDAHEGQTRSSGEPYITHPVAVACILAEMKLDYETLMAALLHDVIEDTLPPTGTWNSCLAKALPSWWKGL